MLIRNIQIKNYKSITHLNLDVPDTDGKWLVFRGNSLKTTILQALYNQLKDSYKVCGYSRNRHFIDNRNIDTNLFDKSMGIAIDGINHKLKESLLVFGIDKYDYLSDSDMSIYLMVNDILNKEPQCVIIDDIDAYNKDMICGLGELFPDIHFILSIRKETQIPSCIKGINFELS